MKIIAVPDVHGCSAWKSPAAKIDDVDKIIFLGDYFDSWDVPFPVQSKNFTEILELKHKYPDKVDLCCGNHDLSYLMHDFYVSGHQHRFDMVIYEILSRCINDLKVVVEYNDWIFSHAGLSKTCMRRLKIKTPVEANGKFFKNYKSMQWQGPDSFGDNLTEGPMWIRPKSLCADAVPERNQCVGHTEFTSKTIETVTSRAGTTLLFIDSPGHDKFLEMDI
jgi:hypothetical protein